MRLGNRERHRRSGGARRPRHLAFPIERRHGGAPLSTCGGHQHTDAPAVEVGVDLQRRDVAGWDRLEPDSLPDAGDGGVIDAARPQNLFAARLFAAVAGIADGNDELLLRCSGLQCLGDVHGPRIESAPVRTGFTSVHPDTRFPVHRAKVQQQPVSCVERGGYERPPVPQPLVGRDPCANATQLRFDRERHENAAGECRGPARVAMGHRKRPFAVEVLPFLPDQLRPRVLRQHLRAIELLSPPCLQASGRNGRGRLRRRLRGLLLRRRQPDRQGGENPDGSSHDPGIIFAWLDRVKSRRSGSVRS